jgi:fumarate hydratase class II
MSQTPPVAFRTERDSMGTIAVPATRLWGAQTQRCLEHFSIGTELMPRELIPAYAYLKKAAAVTNEQFGLLDPVLARMIGTVCDELLSGRHDEEFPLHVWMTGSGTQFNMNVNEVISNRCSQLAGQPLASKQPVHPNDHVNLSQSSNDTFPTAMSIASVLAVRRRLIPAIRKLRDALTVKSAEWSGIIKVGRTHLQDATPLSLGQEFSGFVALLDDDLTRLEAALPLAHRLALGGTAVGTGLNAPEGFDRAVAEEISRQIGEPFVTAPNKFAVQGSHDDLVHLSGCLRLLAVSLSKIANDIRLLGSGPRSGLGELHLPENEPGSSIMPGKVNPTQCEALTMVCAQVFANDLAILLGGAGGILQMNVYKPLIIYNLMQSQRILTDGCLSFGRFLVEGLEPNPLRIAENLQRSLMLVTALSPVIGYDAATKIAHHAHDAALELKAISAEEFDRIVDPRQMIGPDRRSP